MKKILSKLFPNKESIYVGTIIVSIVFIAVSFIPYGFVQAGDILVGLGCSGISAGLLAIFIDLKEKERFQERTEQLRRAVLLSLKEEIECVLGRIIWLHEVIDKIDLTKEIEYFLSDDFKQYAKSLTDVKHITLEDYEAKLNEIRNRFDLSEIQGDIELQKRTKKLFQIIQATGTRIQDEVDILRKNKGFYINYQIFTFRDLNWLTICVGDMVNKFDTYKRGPFALSFDLLCEYKSMCQKFGFDNMKFPIAWQDYDLFELTDKLMDTLLEYRSSHRLQERLESDRSKT